MERACFEDVPHYRIELVGQFSVTSIGLDWTDKAPDGSFAHISRTISKGDYIQKHAPLHA